MINFFRKIRKQIIGGNKTDDFSLRARRYFFYAFGEITLIVIGILIALQINNWNEKKKEQVQEIKMLKELRVDLEQNLSDLETNIRRLEISKNANEIIAHHILDTLAYNDSLDLHFANLYPYITFNINQTTFDNLKQIGINLISNDTLRAKISDLYANQFNSYYTFEKTYLVEHYENYIKPMYMKEFDSFKVFESMKPRDYESFVDNKDYNQILNYSITNYRVFIQIQTGLKIQVEELLMEVEKELGKLG